MSGLWKPDDFNRAVGGRRLMKSSERLHKRRAFARPDFAYNVARAGAEDFRGRTVSRMKREVQCLLKI
jgi:hypothetical protein